MFACSSVTTMLKKDIFEEIYTRVKARNLQFLFQTISVVDLFIKVREKNRHALSLVTLLYLFIKKENAIKLLSTMIYWFRLKKE